MSYREEVPRTPVGELLVHVDAKTLESVDELPQPLVPGSSTSIEVQ